jgi:hypothetical protein
MGVIRLRSGLPIQSERRIVKVWSTMQSDAIKSAEASPGGKGDLMKTFAISAMVLSSVLGFAGGAQAQQAKKLFFEGDIVRHALPDQAGPFCVLANQFKRMVVILGNGQKLPARYGGHGMPPTDHFWSLHWEIPADFPTGSLGYKVVATMMDDSTVSWEPFNRATTQLAVIAGEPAIKQ